MRRWHLELGLLRNRNGERWDPCDVFNVGAFCCNKEVFGRLEFPICESGDYLQVIRVKVSDGHVHVMEPIDASVRLNQFVFRMLSRAPQPRRPKRPHAPTPSEVEVCTARMRWFATRQAARDTCSHAYDLRTEGGRACEPRGRTKLTAAIYGVLLAAPARGSAPLRHRTSKGRPLWAALFLFVRLPSSVPRQATAPELVLTDLLLG